MEGRCNSNDGIQCSVTTVGRTFEGRRLRLFKVSV